MSETITLGDRITAESFEIGSRVVQHVPVLQRFFCPTRAPSSTLTLWEHGRISANYFPGWLEFPPASGKLPSSFSKMGIVKVRRSRIDAYANIPDFQQAIAYRLGKTAFMFGTSNEGPIFGVDPEDDKYYAVAMGIGELSLFVLPGVVDRARRNFISFPGDSIAGPVLDPPDVPIFIPAR